mgnify:CR=1 FL=1
MFDSSASQEKLVKRLREDAPSRSVRDVGPGDFVKIGSRWERIRDNSAYGADHTPRNWTVTTEGGGSYGMTQINRYAKAEDLESR